MRRSWLLCAGRRGELIQRHAPSKARGHLRVVADAEQGGADVGAGGLNEFDRDGRVLRIEACRRLVGQDERRGAGDCAGNRDPLLLADAEGLGRGGGAVDAELIEEAGGTIAVLAGRQVRKLEGGHYVFESSEAVE